MGARNGQTVFDLITNGWSRKIVDRNASDSPHVNIPAQFVREHDIEIGDQVAVKRQDGESPVLELHFDPARSVEDDDEHE